MPDLEHKPEGGCLKVSSKSSPASVAGAIAGMVKDGVKVELQSVGAGAVNQAVKAIAISRGFLSPVGIEIACIPSFADIVIDGEYRTAIRFADRAKEYDIAFLEDPVFADDIEGLRRFREASVVPLATGEHEYTRFGARDLLLRGAVDILQMDTARVGGITEMLKIAALTQAWNIKFAPHCMEYLNLHLLSAFSNSLYAERLYIFNDLWDHAFLNLPKIENGYVSVPEGPGLGLELNMDFVREAAC